MSGDNTAEHAEPVTVGSFATQGEAEVAQAKLSGYGIESAVVDVLEGGAIPVEGEDGLALQVRAGDAKTRGDPRRVGARTRCRAAETEP